MFEFSTPSSSHAVHSFRCVLATVLFALFALRPVDARTLDFDRVIEKVIKKSYDLKIAEVDIKINKLKLTEARAMYFPTLSVRLNNEYVRDLDKEAKGIAYVGETTLNSNDSTYQHSLSVNLNYNLFDFGARGMKYDNTKRDIKLAELALARLVTDIKVNVLSLYTKGLVLTKNIRTFKEILKLKKEIYRLTQKLYKAGAAGKINVTDAAIDLADKAKDLDSYRLELQRVLNTLMFYTGETYEVDSVQFEDFPDTKAKLTRPDVSQMPEIMAYDIEIAKKVAEYEILKRERLPKLSMYSSYRFYGKDSASFTSSFSSMRKRNVSVGVVVDLNLFQGFGDMARGQQLKTELYRLELQRDKKLAEQKKKINTLVDNARLFEHSRTRWNECLAQADNKYEMAQRLTEHKITDRISLLKQQVELLTRQLDITLKKIERVSNRIHLKFLTESVVK